MKRSSLPPDPPLGGLELVEVVDGNDQPLVIMPLVEAHKQTLMHRAVLVLLYDKANRVYLQRRSKNKKLFPGFWDLSATGHVKAGESREDAARRELREELGIDAENMRHLRSVPADASTGWEYITVYSAGRLHGTLRLDPAEVMDGAFHDPDEVAFLVEHYREVLTPALLYAWEHALMFQPAVD